MMYCFGRREKQIGMRISPKLKHCITEAASLLALALAVLLALNLLFLVKPFEESFLNCLVSLFLLFEALPLRPIDPSTLFFLVSCQVLGSYSCLVFAFGRISRFRRHFLLSEGGCSCLAGLALSCL